MDKFSQNEISKINNLFQKFADSSAKLVYSHLDKDIYKKISIKIKEVKTVNAIAEYKQNNFLYKIDYAKEEKQSSLAFLIPEELVAEVTDVMMGGRGENCYNGSLTELQTNSINGLMSKLLKEFEATFKTIFNKNIAFSTDANSLTKENADYNTEFDKSLFNFIIQEELRINDSRSYIFYMLLNSSDIREILINLNLLDGKDKHKMSSSDSIGMGQLENVKIKITAELGHKEIPVKYALELVRGSIVELDTVVNQDIKVYANGVEVALAQIVAVEDDFGLRITKILSPEERIRHL